MPTTISSNTRPYIELSVMIASAYVSNNRVPATELHNLLKIIHDTILTLTCEAVVDGTYHGAAAASETRSGAEIRKSIRPDGLISFLDGRAYKTLKRHLASHGLDPKSYCVRYGLPADYPMVADEYRARRSALATQIGLGRMDFLPSPRR